MLLKTYCSRSKANMKITIETPKLRTMSTNQPSRAVFTNSLSEKIKTGVICVARWGILMLHLPFDLHLSPSCFFHSRYLCKHLGVFMAWVQKTCLWSYFYLYGAAFCLAICFPLFSQLFAVFFLRPLSKIAKW